MFSNVFYLNKMFITQLLLTKLYISSEQYFVRNRKNMK
jgi:hypothetical protein